MPRPYLARVRARIEVGVGLDGTGRLSVEQTVQYLDLLRREQLPSHLLPEEVTPAVPVTVSQRRLLQTLTQRRRKRGLGKGGREREERMERTRGLRGKMEAFFFRNLLEEAKSHRLS